MATVPTFLAQRPNNGPLTFSSEKRTPLGHTCLYGKANSPQLMVQSSGNPYLKFDTRVVYPRSEHGALRDITMCSAQLSISLIKLSTFLQAVQL